MFAAYKAFVSSLAYALPALLAIGTLGNVLCFITLRGKSFGSSPPTSSSPPCSSSTNASSALSDFVASSGCLCVTTYALTRHALRSCFPLLIVSCFYLRHLSAFLVCLLTVERLIAVYVPLRCKQLCSARRIKIVCCSAFVAYFIINGLAMFISRKAFTSDTELLNVGDCYYC